MWLPFRYREFHDVPRAIVVEYRGQSLFLESRYDDERDDYEEFYTVYRVPAGMLDAIEALSWADLGQRSERIGSVRVAAVEFDRTKRRMLNARALDTLKHEA